MTTRTPRLPRALSKRLAEKAAQAGGALRKAAATMVGGGTREADPTKPPR